jgi:hypothetical protein
MGGTSVRGATPERYPSYFRIRVLPSGRIPNRWDRNDTGYQTTATTGIDRHESKKQKCVSRRRPFKKTHQFFLNRGIDPFGRVTTVLDDQVYVPKIVTPNPERLADMASQPRPVDSPSPLFSSDNNAQAGAPVFRATGSGQQQEVFTPVPPLKRAGKLRRPL